ncbi:hypothetical protein GC176_18165 [bacterium]|nr:hypothetical protein [bacterium]
MRSRRIELLWLVLTGLLVLLSGWWLPGSGNLHTDSYGVSFAGRKVLYQTVSRLDENVHRSVDELIPRSGYDDRLLILGPARYPTAEEWERLYTAVLDGTTLIFAASASDPHVDTGPFQAKVVSEFGIMLQQKPDDDDNGKDRRKDNKRTAKDSDGDEADARSQSKNADGGSPADELDSGNNAQDEGADEGSGELRLMLQLEGKPAETELVDTPVKWKSNAEIETEFDDWDILLTVEDEPQIIRRSFGRGTFLLVASDEIFSNGAMLNPDRAVLAYRILQAGGQPFEATWFDETLNASGVPQVLGILFAAEFRPITLQLLLILILFGWLGCRRFGPAEQTQHSRRRSIVEHAEAVGILYLRGEAGAHAVRAQREFLRQELRRLCGPAFRVDDPASVARQAQTVEADVRELLETVDGVEKFDAPLTNAAAGRLLRGLSTLITRIRKEPPV